MNAQQHIKTSRTDQRKFNAPILSGSMNKLAKIRASLMAQLPECMRGAEQQARDALAGQNDMFGAASPATPKRSLVEAPDWPIAQMLSGERDTLGYYLSGHRTDAWKDLLKEVTTCAVGDIDKVFKPPSGERRSRFVDLQPFTLAGSVIAIRKQGDSRAFVTVEDFSGKFEAVLYRDSWIEHGPLLTRDANLVFEGGVSIDDFSGGISCASMPSRRLRWRVSDGRGCCG